MFIPKYACTELWEVRSAVQKKMGGDGVHMNPRGYDALRRIVHWGILPRAKGDVFEFEDGRVTVRAVMKF